MDRQMIVVIRAWFQLDSTRPCIFYTEVVNGMPVTITRRGSIPWDKIRDWGRDEGLSRESIHLLTAAIHIQEK